MYVHKDLGFSHPAGLGRNPLVYGTYTDIRHGHVTVSTTLKLHAVENISDVNAHMKT